MGTGVGMMTASSLVTLAAIQQAEYIYNYITCCNMVSESCIVSKGVSSSVGKGACDSEASKFMYE